MSRHLLFTLALQLILLQPAAGTTTVWLIGYDRTASLSNGAFRRLPDWNRDAILPLLKPGDTCSLVFVDHVSGRPVPDPITRVLDSRTRQLTRQVVEFDAAIRAQKQAPRSSQTDVGVLFQYLRRTIELDTAAHVKRRYVLTAWTDGRPDGRQTSWDGKEPVPAQADYWILFLGIDDEMEAGIREMARRTGFDNAARILVVPHALVDQSIGLIQQFTGRSVNVSLAEALKRGPTPAAAGRR